MALMCSHIRLLKWCTPVHELQSSSWCRKVSQLRQESGTQSRKDLLAELKACSCTRILERGKAIHGKAIQNGHDCCIYVATALVNMYAKCGSMVDARQVFDRMVHPNVVSWTCLILGYAENGEGVTALELFARMKSQGCAPNSITFVAALKACTSLALKGNEKRACRHRGKQIHLEIGCHSNICVENTLIDMYAKCRTMRDARQVFDDMKRPDVVSWNALISGYAENGEGVTALDLFATMRSKGCAPNSITFVAALKACSSLVLKQDESEKVKCRERGKQIHLEIGCHLNTCVQNTLIDMYSKCGGMTEARQVFDGMKHPTVVSWTALILGYAENGEGFTAMDLFARMRFEGFSPDSIIYLAAIKACSSLAVKQHGNGKTECRELGKQVHLEIGRHLNTCVQNALIDMYAKCERMAEARHVFNGMKHPDVVSWNALILGYAENGEAVTALEVLAGMRLKGCAPNSITFVAALKACGMLGALKYGSKLHAEIDSGTELDGMLLTSLVDFYAKCGSMVEAHKVFDSHHLTSDLRTWTALLAGYGRLGDHKAMFRLFEGMQDAGFQPNGVTFLCILACCSHAGLVDKANEFFELMSSKYGILPAMEHHNCMIDILGRSDKLEDVIALLQGMPKSNTVTWMTVLDACRKLKNVEIGRLAFKSLLNLDDTIGGAYVLMAHIYGSKGMMEEQEMVFKAENNIPKAHEHLDRQEFQMRWNSKGS